ncbi:MAG TPA: lytic transglycosylase domain-containing protein [Terriglobales bacterium]|nr:lytic transglycosylase domain-containing protein [Terriglobales bacterium]
MSGSAKLASLAIALLLTLPAWCTDPSLPAKPPGPRVAYLAVLRNGFSIQHLRSEVRDGGVTRLYIAGDDFVDVSTAQIASVETVELAPDPPALPPQTPTIPQLVDLASDKHRVDADFIRSVIRAESNFNLHAVSPKGAQGLMQLMPQTALQLGVQDAFDPGANIEAGTRYLRELLMQYHGDVAKALAAYNAGPQRVEQYRGVPPYRETRAYVRRVINDYNRSKSPQKKDTPASALANGK